MEKLRTASSVIITRGPATAPEVFLAQRSPALSFFGGYWAFPGGNVSAIDRHAGDEPLDLILTRCAVRELFEELQILSSTLGREFSREEKQYLLQQLQTSPQTWWRQLPITAFNIEHVCSITTPPFFPVRYETRFMHLPLRDGEVPEIDNRELINGAFFTPERAIHAWEHGNMDIAPPVLFLLHLLRGRDLDSFKRLALQKTAELTHGALHDIYFSPGVFTAPLNTPTLPPATTTNTYIIGTQQLYIIDPATPDTAEQQRLFDKMDEFIAAGKVFKAILLTHHHIDHVGAVAATSERYRLPVRAHPLCYQHMHNDFIKGEPLQDEDILDLGSSPDANDNWQLSVIHTPGHAVDHLCFFETRYGALIAGDMLSTVSTIVIDPPHGHMRTYLDSLEKLLNFPIRTLYPAHGPAHRDGPALIRKFLQHRAHREKEIINALSAGAQTLEQLLPAVYADVPETILPMAARSLLAGLIKLEEDGICANFQGKWKLINTGTQ